MFTKMVVINYSQITEIQMYLYRSTFWLLLCKHEQSASDVDKLTAVESLKNVILTYLSC
jgi:hypothetical protein